MPKTIDIFPKKPDWGTVLLVVVLVGLTAWVVINFFIQKKLI